MVRGKNSGGSTVGLMREREPIQKEWYRLGYKESQTYQDSDFYVYFVQSPTGGIFIIMIINILFLNTDLELIKSSKVWE